MDEMNTKWDYEINHATNNQNNWMIWKKENMERFQNGFIIPYYGILDDKIICECTAAIHLSVVQNADSLVDEKTAYLTAFRTIRNIKDMGIFQNYLNI